MKSSKQRPRAKTQSLDGISLPETPLHIAALEGDVTRLRALIRKNTYQINATGDRNFTALHFAANAGELEACKLLLRAGADSTLKTELGDSALQLLSTRSFEDETTYRCVVEMMLKQDYAKRASALERAKESASSTIITSTTSNSINSNMTDSVASLVSTLQKAHRNMSTPRENLPATDVCNTRKISNSNVQIMDLDALEQDVLSQSKDTEHGTNPLSFTRDMTGHQRSKGDRTEDEISDLHDVFQDGESSTDYHLQRKAQREERENASDSQTADDWILASRKASSEQSAPDSSSEIKSNYLSKQRSHSTEFETTESSDPNHFETFHVVPVPDSDQSQALHYLAKDILLDAWKLRKIRQTKSSHITRIPKVIMQARENMKQRGPPLSPRALVRQNHQASENINNPDRGGAMHHNEMAKQQPLTARLSVNRLLKKLFDDSEPAEEYVVDFLKLHRFFIPAETLLKHLIQKYSLHSKHGGVTVPIKTRSRILQMMSVWFESYFPDLWMKTELIEMTERFLGAVGSSEELKPTTEFTELTRIFASQIHRQRQQHQLTESTSIYNHTPHIILTAPNGSSIHHSASNSNSNSNSSGSRIHQTPPPQSHRRHSVGGGVSDGRANGNNNTTSTSTNTNSSHNYGGNNHHHGDTHSWSVAQCVGMEQEKLLTEHSPTDFANELTLLLSERVSRLTPLDFALFHQNKEILVNCPNIVYTYELIDRIRRYIATQIVLKGSRKQRVVVIEYFIKVANKCWKLRNYCGALIIVQALISESIGRLEETWKLVASKKVNTMQTLLHSTRTMDALQHIELAQRGIPFVPDLELLLNEYISSCSLAHKQSKIDLKRGRQLNELLDILKRAAPFPLESVPDVRTLLLMRIRPLPDGMAQHYSLSHESVESFKPKTVQLTIRSLECRISRGKFLVVHGKLDDFLDLLLDTNFSAIADDQIEELFLTHKYYESAGPLLSKILSKLDTPSVEKFSPSERIVILRKHVAQRQRIMQLLHRWCALNSRELKQEPEVLQVLRTFVDSANLFSSNETFFFVTTLYNSCLSHNKKINALRIQDCLAEQQQSGPIWSNDMIFKPNFPKLAAKQLCLIDSEMFGKITAIDLIEYSSTKKNKRSSMDGPNRVEEWATRFNTVYFWSSSIIVAQEELSTRALALKQFIKLAWICLMMNNFNSSYAIFAALFSHPISRLRNTWKELSPATDEKFKRLLHVFDTAGGHRNYRVELTKAKPPIVPWLGIYTKDIFSVKEHHPNHLAASDLINFEKFSSLVRIIRDMSKLQTVPYSFIVEPAAKNYLKDLKTMNEQSILSASLKLELNRVNNPIFQNSRLDFSLPNKDGKGTKMIVSKNVDGEVTSRLHKTNSFHISVKTFVDEEGRKTEIVKNPIYQNELLTRKRTNSTAERPDSDSHYNVAVGRTSTFAASRSHSPSLKFPLFRKKH